MSAAGSAVLINSRLSARGRAAALVSFAGLPLLVFVIHSNASDVTMRAFGVPSILQPLIAVLGGAALLLHRELAPRHLLQPLTVALAVWCGIVVLSTIWARDLAVADERAAETLKGLAIYLVILAITPSWRALRVAVVAMVASATLLSVLTLAQIASGDPANEMFGFARAQTATLWEHNAQPRAAGPVGDPNFFAQILIIVLPVAVFAAVAERNRRRRTAFALAAGAILAGTLATYSRGAVLALAIMGVLILLTFRTTKKSVRPAAVIAILLMLAVVAIPLGIVRRMSTVEAAVSPTQQQDSSIAKRKLLMAAAWRIFEEHPLLGCGAGNFGREFYLARNEVGFGATLYEEPGARHFPHTLYLEIASENGIIGILSFGAAVGIALAGLRRAQRRLRLEDAAAPAATTAGLAIGMIGYLVSSLFLHGAFQRYLWLLLAFAAVVIRLTRDATPAAAPPEVLH